MQALLALPCKTAEEQYQTNFLRSRFLSLNKNFDEAIKIMEEILVDELIAKFLWKVKGTRIVKNILKKKKSSLRTLSGLISRFIIKLQ